MPGSRRGSVAAPWAGPVLVAAVPILGVRLLTGSGFVLHSDSVAVPKQDLLPWMWGAGSSPPRSVPQDALVAVLDDAIPGWLLQRLLIAAGVLLLGFGVARLLAGRTAVERVSAAAVAMWSTYLFERMAMGHWALLLGVGVIPWLVDALSAVRRGEAGAVPRAVSWAAVGSLVPTAGVLMTATAVAVLGWPGVRKVRGSVAALLGVIALQLVWVVPGLTNPGAASSEAADVFGLRSEGPAGPLLTALGTGGIWNDSAAPGSRGGVLGVVAPTALFVLAIVGSPRLRALPSAVVGPLVVMSMAGLTWAVSTAVPSMSTVVLAVEGLPGGGLLRDAHKWLAPWVVLLALSAGLGLARLVEPLRRAATGPAVALVLVVPIALLPDLAFGMWGRLDPAAYPADWDAVRSHLAETKDPGDVLSWPWSAFRSYEWNDGRTVLDPAPRYLPRVVVGDGRLLVQQEDRLVVVAGDDSRSSAVGAALLGPDPVDQLLAQGVGWVLVQSGQPGTPGFPTELPSAIERRSDVVLNTPTLELRQLAGSPKSLDPGRTVWHRVTWAIWLVVLAGVALAGVRHLRSVRWA